MSTYMFIYIYRLSPRPILECIDGFVVHVRQLFSEVFLVFPYMHGNDQRQATSVINITIINLDRYIDG